MIAKEKKTVKFMCDLSAEQESKQVLMTAADYNVACVVNQEITSLQPREEARLKILNEWNMNCDEDDEDEDDEDEDDEDDEEEEEEDAEDNYGDDEKNSYSDDSSSSKQNDSAQKEEEEEGEGDGEEEEEEGFQSACEGHVYDKGSYSRACSLQLEVAHEVSLHRNCFGADLSSVDKGTESKNDSTDDTNKVVEYNIWNSDNSSYRKKQVKSSVSILI